MTDPRSGVAVREALLAHLRARALWAGARYVAEPVPVFGGNQSFVYALELEAAGDLRGPLILRILRPFLAQDSVGREAIVQDVLSDAGYPVARVLHHCSDPRVLGGPFQLMERLSGSPIVGAGSATQGTIGLRAALVDFRAFVFGPWPEQIAALQQRLHAMPPDELRETFTQRGLDPDTLSFEATLGRLVARANDAECDGLGAVFAWLERGVAQFVGERDVLCHGDFFPNQVMVDAGRVSGVIDWTDACFAPPELDVAVLRVGIETLPVPVPLGDRVLRARARRFFEAYQASIAAHGRGPLDADALDYAEAFRCTYSLLSVAERRRALAASPKAPPNPNPYDSPGAIASLSARLQRITGSDASIPAAEPS